MPECVWKTISVETSEFCDSKKSSWVERNLDVSRDVGWEWNLGRRRQTFPLTLLWTTSRVQGDRLLDPDDNPCFLSSCFFLRVAGMPGVPKRRLSRLVNSFVDSGHTPKITTRQRRKDSTRSRMNTITYTI